MSRDEQDFANLRFHVRSDRTIAAFARRDDADNWARDRSYNFRCLCKVCAPAIVWCLMFTMRVNVSR